MRGLVLDFDGVLVRSMELHAEAYRRVLRPSGISPSNREVFLLEGARSETLIRELLEKRGLARDAAEVDALAHAKQEIFASLGPARLYPGAAEMFARVRRAVDRLGLVTGTRRENLERLIPELLPRLDAVLAQDAYEKDKPDPEPYRRAAEALAIAPSDCAALENAVRGVQSAKGAGYAFVVAMTTTLRSDELAGAGADRVVTTQAEAASAIEEWTRR